MSALTKIFVVLLIVCSLMLTAATVVFVNVNQSYKSSWEQQGISMERLKRELSASRTDAEASRAEAIRAASRYNELSNASAVKAQAMQATLDKAVNDLNEYKAKDNVNQATITHVTNALDANQKLLASAQDRNKSLVAELDKVHAQNTELVATNTDLTKRLEQTEAQRTFLVEQNAQVTADLTKAKNLLIENRIALDSPRSVVPMVDVKGVIKSVRMENGVAFATISVGSNDHVVKDMKFNVIDQNTAEFLGYFVVDTVNANEAFGRLEGPKVQNVKPDHQVLSQL